MNATDEYNSWRVSHQSDKQAALNAFANWMLERQHRERLEQEIEKLKKEIRNDQP